MKEQEENYLKLVRSYIHYNADRHSVKETRLDGTLMIHFAHQGKAFQVADCYRQGLRLIDRRNSRLLATGAAGVVEALRRLFSHRREKRAVIPFNTGTPGR